MIKFELKELRKLSNNNNSCVVEKKITQNLALQPWCLGNIQESIKNLLDYKIGKFDKDFNGILLSFKNLHVLHNVGTIRNDKADVHFQVQADYFIFRPYVGAKLKGVVNKKCSTHLGILVHRVFNVVIPRPTEEPGNKWIGTSIQEGQDVEFKIVVLDLFGALPYIRGELDENWLKNFPADGELEETKIQPVHVSYVNFDKTKPQLHSECNPELQQKQSKDEDSNLEKPKTKKSPKVNGKQNNTTKEIRRKKRVIDSEQSEGSPKKPKKV